MKVVSIKNTNQFAVQFGNGSLDSKRYTRQGNAERRIKILEAAPAVEAVEEVEEVVEEVQAKVAPSPTPKKVKAGRVRKTFAESSLAEKGWTEAQAVLVRKRYESHRNSGCEYFEAILKVKESMTSPAPEGQNWSEGVVSGLVKYGGRIIRAQEKAMTETEDTATVTPALELEPVSVSSEEEALKAAKVLAGLSAEARVALIAKLTA